MTFSCAVCPRLLRFPVPLTARRAEWEPRVWREQGRPSARDAAAGLRGQEPARWGLPPVETQPQGHRYFKTNAARIQMFSVSHK